MKSLNYSHTQNGKHHQAFMFVDYDNLHDYVDENRDEYVDTNSVINSLLNACVYYVKNELQLQLTSSVAYADFTMIDSAGPQIQQNLYLAGMEPRFVPASLQSNASEIQICIDLLEILNHHQDPSAVLIVSGDRLYLPLINHIQQKNIHSSLISFTSPDLSTMDHNPECFISAHTLITNQPYSEVLPSAQPAPQNKDLMAQPSEAIQITDNHLLAALHVIVYFFRQYEDIYLTPLLRKLSELLPDHDDPKPLINQLKNTGAIWLEKRPGFPYNYTVLLINYQHPNVIETQNSIEKSQHVEEEAYLHLRETSRELHHLEEEPYRAD
ncbi:MAG: NYN domain-containing protein [Bacteroidetes bacterium]|nr:NYN domain-containing protein [Bacteroidota bacterium]